MNRFVITLDENGEVDHLSSDEPIEVYFVDPNCHEDRVYFFGSVRVGLQYVRQEIGGYAVGHANDGTLDLGGSVSPKLPPSKPHIGTAS